MNVAPTGAELEALRQAARADIRDLRKNIDRLDGDGVDLILRRARSHYAWTDAPVTDDDIRAIYDIAKMGPTSMNSHPARFLIVRSTDARTRLATALKPKNVDKMMSAPCTVIIAYDIEFWRKLPELFPHEDRRPHFIGKARHSELTAFRNGTLQGAYFIIAARSLGFDVGPMSGFSNEIVDREFFADTTLRSNFLCNIGRADEQALFQRLPRPAFEDVSQVI